MECPQKPTNRHSSVAASIMIDFKHKDFPFLTSLYYSLSLEHLEYISFLSASTGTKHSLTAKKIRNNEINNQLKL